jgi:hypothetical protein
MLRVIIKTSSFSLRKSRPRKEIAKLPLLLERGLKTEILSIIESFKSLFLIINTNVVFSTQNKSLQITFILLPLSKKRNTTVIKSSFKSLN